MPCMDIYGTQIQPLILGDSAYPLKRECPPRPSHITNMWHKMKNRNFSHFAQRW